MIMKTRLGALLPLIFFLPLSYAEAQTFELLDGSGRPAARVEVVPEGLLFDRFSGGQRLYRRAPQFDLRDGSQLGYFHRRSNRAVRFPMAGRGPLLVANLNEPVPQFRYSGWNVRRISRPLPGWGHRPYDPWPATPWVYSYDLAPYLHPWDYGYRRPQPLPRSVLIDSQVIPNPPLEPVNVELFNDSRRDLQVTIDDLQNPSATRSVRIQPGSSQEIRFARDSGAERIEYYRVIDPYGGSRTKRVVRQIEPQVRYELTVHQWNLQSIAIDRTGKSPNVIEDAQFQGKGIGRFVLPPGDNLQPGRIDVYRAAKAQANQGAVAPLLPEDPGDEISPLERALLEAQRSATQ